MFRGNSSKADSKVLFSWYVDYHLWEITLKMGIEAILEDKNMNTKLKNIDRTLCRENELS